MSTRTLEDAGLNPTLTKEQAAAIGGHLYKLEHGREPGERAVSVVAIPAAKSDLVIPKGADPAEAGIVVAKRWCVEFDAARAADAARASQTLRCAIGEALRGECPLSHDRTGENPEAVINFAVSAGDHPTVDLTGVTLFPGTTVSWVPRPADPGEPTGKPDIYTTTEYRPLAVAALNAVWPDAPSLRPRS